MTTRPSNDAIAQAFWEWVDKNWSLGEAVFAPADLLARAYDIDEGRPCATTDNPEVSGSAHDWLMVPREPTSEMRCAGFECDAWDALGDAVMEKGGWPYSCRESAECVTAIYKAMLKAAPMLPKAEAVAYCAPDDPHNATAFAWPGTMRIPHIHTMPLYTAQPAPTTDVISDAELYRWLRDHANPGYAQSGKPWSVQCSGIEIRGWPHIDELIAAAIREQQRGENNER